MNLFFASIGTVLGSVYFILGGHRVFIAALICLFISSSVFTSLAKYKKEILSILFAFLIVFFNFNLRSEHLEYLDPQIFDLSQKLIIVSHPKDKFFKSSFIIEIKEQNPSFKTKIRETFLPYRLLASADSSQGLSKGDIIKIEGKPEITKIKKPDYYRSQKTFFEIKNKINYAGNKNNWILGMQNKIQRYYRKHMNDTNASITTSLIMGSRLSKIPYQLNSQIRDLGLGHFFAASGFHLVMLSLALFWLFRLFRLNKFISNISIISCSLLYMAIAGFSPSIVRAAIFISLYLILDLLKRKPKTTKLLFYVAAAILIIDPHTIFDLGFQFSYLATLAILLWAGPIRKKLDFLPGYIADIASVSLAVQIFLLPVIIYYFDIFQPWTLIANIVFTPLLSLITLCSFAGLYFIVDPLLNIFKHLVELSQQLPYIHNVCNIRFETLVLLLTGMNLLAYSFTNKATETKTEMTHDVYIMIKNIFMTIINNNYSRSAIMLGIVMVTIGFNIYPPYIKQIKVNNGRIDHPQVNEFMQSNLNHQYFKVNNLNALAIKDRSSIEKIANIGDIKEVNLLILPKLNAKDIYLDTLLDLTKPQFVISSANSHSERVSANLKRIGANANTIVNNGRLNIGHDKFWSIDSI